MFFGNTLLQTGLRITALFSSLIIPFALIFLGLKKIGIGQGRNIIALFILSISSLLYATVLALTAGHIISFQQLYATFSVPYAIIILGYCIFLIAESAGHQLSGILKTGIALQVLIMLVSISFIYQGLDSNAKDINKFEMWASKIKAIQSNETADFMISYKDTITAKEMNKYLNGVLGNIKQVVDTTKTNPALFLKFEANQKRVILEE